jgi:hypothetical protein
MSSPNIAITKFFLEQNTKETHSLHLINAEGHENNLLFELLCIIARFTMAMFEL